MRDPEPRRDRCPLCGRDNACGMVRGDAACWCVGVEFSKEALARIPPELVGVACLCADCASGAAPSPCVGVCEVDPASSTCRGCLRTTDEIEAWGTLGEADRHRVLARCAERRRDAGAA